MWSAILLGLGLGARHAADPDHLVAMSTLMAHHPHRRAGLVLGLAWGLGHSATILAAGVLVIGLRLAIPALVAASMECAVGGMLVVLGVTNLRRAGQPTVPAADGQAPGRALGPAGVRSFGVGAVHGLAGTATVVLLALAAMPGTAAAVAYLAVFSVGSIVGMAAISFGLGLPFARALERPMGRRVVVAATGAISVLIGGYLIYELGVVRGLL